MGTTAGIGRAARLADLACNPAATSPLEPPGTSAGSFALFPPLARAATTEARPLRSFRRFLVVNLRRWAQPPFPTRCACTQPTGRGLWPSVPGPLYPNWRTTESHPHRRSAPLCEWLWDGPAAAPLHPAAKADGLAADRSSHPGHSHPRPQAAPTPTRGGALRHQCSRTLWLLPPPPPATVTVSQPSRSHPRLTPSGSVPA